MANTDERERCHNPTQYLTCVGKDAGGSWIKHALAIDAGSWCNHINLWLERDDGQEMQVLLSPSQARELARRLNDLAENEENHPSGELPYPLRP